MKGNYIFGGTMKRVIAVVALVLAAGVCFGQQRLVVPPFQNRNSGIDVSQIETLTDLFINSIQRTNRFEVPDRDALALMTAEAKFQMSDWSDDTKTIEMGRVLTANYIVRVILSKIDANTYLMITRLLEVNTVKILDSAELEFTSVRDARTKLDAFARDCLDNIRTASEAAQQQKQREEQERRANPLVGKWQAILRGSSTDCYMTFRQDGTFEISGLNTTVYNSWSSPVFKREDTKTLRITNPTAKGTYTVSSTNINLSLDISGKIEEKTIEIPLDFRGRPQTQKMKRGEIIYDFSENLLIKSTYSITVDRLSFSTFLVNDLKVIGTFLNMSILRRRVYEDTISDNIPHDPKNTKIEYINWVKVQ